MLNPYFRQNNTSVADQRLLNSLVVETIQIHGREMYYVPREYVALDLLYGEDKLSAFTQAFPLEFYIKSIQTFEGDEELLSKFGLEVRDEIQLTLSKSRFFDEVVSRIPAILRPREGDLVWVPLDKSLFEITYVEDKEAFFQLGNLFTYGIKAKRFEVAGELIKTGINAIDDTEGLEHTKVFTVVSGLGDYMVGEEVYQGESLQTAVFIAIVLNWDYPLLTVQRTYSEELPLANIIGSISAASWSINDESTTASEAPMLMNDSSTIKTESQTDLDDTEINPYTGRNIDRSAEGQVDYEDGIDVWTEDGLYPVIMDNDGSGVDGQIDVDGGCGDLETEDEIPVVTEDAP